MKTDPSVAYNHMEEDNQNKSSLDVSENSHPISLYLILAVDAILISAIIFFTVKIIF